jgi:hypothetical protein
MRVAAVFDDLTLLPEFHTELLKQAGQAGPLVLLIPLDH